MEYRRSSQQWITTIQRGYYAEIAPKFALNGSQLATMTEEQFLRRSPEMGDLSFNEVQRLKKEDDHQCTVNSLQQYTNNVFLQFG